jgi:hypothetical protein
MAQFFTRPNIEDRTMVQYSSMVINLSGTTAIANPGYLKINQGAAPGLVATSLDFDGTVVWGPVSGLSWSISACTSPLYVNNIVACPSSAGTIVVQSGILTVNGALQLNPTLSGGTAGDRLLVIDSNGYVKVGQTGTSISSLSYNNNNLTLTLNDGSIFTATINTMTGLTINGNLTVSGNTRIVGNTSVIGNLNVTGNTSINGSVSATTYYGDGSNLTGIPDYYVTGGTFGGNVLTLNRQNGSVTIAGFTGFTDNFVTGGTYNYSTGTLTLNRQNGSLSVSGLSFTGNTLGTCITDIYVQNLYGCSNPITIGSSLKSSAGGSTAAGTSAFAFGNNVAATGNFSMAQGNGTSTAGGTYAHAEGANTTASGLGSHAEGLSTTSSGQYAHAEGRGTVASGNYSHAQGLFTNATTEGTFASGSGSTASGANSFIHSVGSTVSGNRSVVLGGFGINGTSNDFVYVPSLNINTTPTNNDSNAQILSRNSSTGNIEYTNLSLLTAYTDTFVTGFTYNNANRLTISRNGSQPDLTVNINRLTGLTVTNGLSADTLTLTTMAVTASTSTQALVRNTTTGVVESRPFGLESIILVTSASTIPIAGVGPSFDSIKGIPQGQVITGYTTIYSNNVSQSGPTVNTNFGTYDNTTGLFTTNVNATLMLNAYIHLKPDTSTSTAWSLSGTGEFGIGICPNNATDIYVGDYQTIIPDPDTAQYVYELYGANAPRTNQIDISISTVIYAASNSSFRVKVLNKTDRNYTGVQGDGIRFSITRIM